MDYEAHGGECCGYGHVYGFDNASIHDLDRCISEHNRAANGTNRILEAILSHRQINRDSGDRAITGEVREAGGWAAILERKGFRLAAQWTNSNTGRQCYQFLLIDDLLTDDPNYVPPFDWGGQRLVPVEGEPQPAPAPAPAPHIFTVETEYYANLQERGRRGPFRSEAAARQVFPRCRRFERRAIRSNGQSIWTPTA